ncbi:heat shock protein transcriptional repressor HspR [Pseudonocardia sp. N23]|uniref:heat shock protein transcriptional repressor HspR n=1 Tax=Pseudonocardia sp. N23 TaxID=1987376 RepID=UPI000BFB1ED6|nr:helix-turn-helix transcriptional regulator [Pseudonocardia sp. N23]GAY11042.1 HspR, transcriptional repressor of DnaK operon [Pseudonocardia sp. N23]
MITSDGDEPVVDAVLPPGAGADSPVFVISIAAELAGMHAQTLRSYDRLGLVSPGRSAGGGRRYSARDIALLREVQRLSQVDGVNLAGVKRIIELEQLVDELNARVEQLTAELSAAHAAAEHAAAVVHQSYRRDLVPVDRRQALVVWRPKPRNER